MFTDGRTDRRTDRQTDGRTEGRTEGGIAIALSQIGWLGAKKCNTTLKLNIFIQTDETCTFSAEEPI